MNTIEIHASRNYSILVDFGLLPGCGELIREACPKSGQVAIVTDDHVAPLYSELIAETLAGAGLNVCTYIAKSGEQTKSLAELEKLYNFLAEKRLTRDDALIALGGGVIGDLAGFCAATFLRGIDYIQIPTTLLAQIDSSVGGKTAVNIESGKNLVGAFKQPKLVICDVGTLSSLPESEFANGVAEAIKYGAISDPKLFNIIASGSAREHLLEIIVTCIKLKKEFVEADEFDTGKRMALNFGHTFGHAIEKEYGYSGYSHGMGVAAGMSMITELSEQYGMTASGVAQKIQSCLTKNNLPIVAGISKEHLIEYSLVDKKSSSSGIRIILLKDIGEYFICPLSKEQYIDFVKGDFSYEG